MAYKLFKISLILQRASILFLFISVHAYIVWWAFVLVLKSKLWFQGDKKSLDVLNWKSSKITNNPT